MFPRGNYRPRRVSLAVVALASGYGQLAGSQTIPDEPPAHPRCGAPVRALGAPQLQRAYGLPAMPYRQQKAHRFGRLPRRPG